jgi:tetratricopeptide (TPR) repeat protein
MKRLTKPVTSGRICFMRIRLRKKNSAALLPACAAVLLLVTFGSMQAQEAMDVAARHQQAALEAQQRQDFVTAIREYQALARIVPQSGEVQSNLGIAFYFHGEYQRSAEVFRHALALNPNLHAPLLFLGLAVLHMGNTKEAELLLDKALRQDERDGMARKWLGYTYNTLGRYQDAASLLETAGAVEANDPEIWYALGQARLSLAREATSKLLVRFPDGERVWQLAAEQSDAQGNHARAVRLHEGAARRRSSEEEDALYAEACDNGRKAREAFAHLDADSYRAHQILGDAAVAAGHWDEAIAEYGTALQRSPEQPGAHGQLCNALLRAARTGDAIRECDAELGILPHNVTALVDAAHAHLMGGEEERSLALLTEARKTGPLPTAAEKLLGKILLDRKQYAESIRALQRYLVVEKRDASAYYILARACRGIGDNAGAVAAIAGYKKYSEAVRSATEAQRALEAPQKIEDGDEPTVGDAKQDR